jgi:HEAT repeat protein
MRKLPVFALLLLITGCGRQPSTNDWIERLKDPDASHRLAAVRALAKTSDEEAVVPALAGALRDENYYVRRDAAAALGKMGPAARLAAPSLVAALNDKERSVRKAAAEALKKVDTVLAAKARLR